MAAEQLFVSAASWKRRADLAQGCRVNTFLTICLPPFDTIDVKVVVQQYNADDDDDNRLD